jgi:hypothetical protein
MIMTSIIHPNSSPSKLQPHQMQLGKVTFQGRTYLAILHYMEDEAPAPITENMKAAQETFRSVVQTMLDTVDGPVPKSLLKRVSADGFKFVVEKSSKDAVFNPSHPQLKTEEIWKRFSYLLLNPEITTPSLTHIEFVDITNLTEEEKIRILKTVLEKFEGSTTTQIELSEQEKAVLTMLGYQRLSQNIRDEEEIITLTAFINLKAL